MQQKQQQCVLMLQALMTGTSYILGDKKTTLTAAWRSYKIHEHDGVEQFAVTSNGDVRVRPKV